MEKIKTEEPKIIINLIDEDHKADINIKNDSFLMPGRFLPSYIDGKWDYKTEKFEKTESMVFPDENYSFEEISKKGFVLGAYVDGKCVGIVILQHSWFKYLYVYDLKVCQAYRNMHIGSKLIDKAKELAVQQNYIGLYLQAQDNNLSACMFYLHNGFEIGGINTNIYKGTNQEGKIDIFFYTK